MILHELVVIALFTLSKQLSIVNVMRPPGKKGYKGKMLLTIISF